ncbi:MAG TPA: YIP1 family protein [Acidimicrobiia bacterium]|jgi:hypothetical protein|nr:YIP1 family protein [Acidimicrobiia bacterium]
MEALQRALRLSFFDRRTANQIMFDHSATGDAVLLVAAVQAAVIAVLFLRAGAFSPMALLEGAIGGIAGWLFLSFAIWLMGTRVLKGSGDAQTMIRTTGFGTLPLLLGAAGYGWVGLVWHLAILVLVARVVLGLDWAEAGGAVALGAALIYLIQTLLGAALFRF